MEHRTRKYKGVIIEESLEDAVILEKLQVLSQKISDDLQWHMDTVMIDEGDFEGLARSIKSGTWYMHFWKGRDVVAIFREKVFHFNYDEKKSWDPVIEYGKSLGIPDEQLDFPIE